jgi:glycerol kinase
MKYLLALDQGTTSSRSILFDQNGAEIATAQREFPQLFPEPAWVEHDPEEIWRSQIETAREAIEKAGVNPAEIAAIGITNQRETTLLWERSTGRPVANAIVWQCRRTTPICMKLKAAGLEKEVRERTGLVIDPYFSATKIMWLLEHIPGLRARAERGEIAFGTVDSWLLYRLTGRHLTDPSNASRTMLYNIYSGTWDTELLEAFGLPQAMLAEVVPSSGVAGISRPELLGAPIPVAGIAGDQQAALFGQACFTPGSVKNTYGTGCFTLMHTGSTPVRSENNLLTTIAWDTGTGPEYAIEGGVFTAGAVVQWLRDQLALIGNAAESERLATEVPSSDGVYMVPAFNGLGAPYWSPETRGTILGITRGTTRAHIVRAALESIAFQSRDLIKAMQSDSGRRIELLRVDGGASMNGFLMQFQADILGIPVERPVVAETTAFGAACLAGLAVGVFASREEVAACRKIGARFTPRITPAERETRLNGWKNAVEAARVFTGFV